MPLNCPHAWKEYKQLDLAYDALRREYLALRGEQSNDNSNEFKNVHKEWLVKMREVRGKVKGFVGEFNNFSSNNFLMLYRAKEIMGDQFYGPEDIKNAFGFEVGKDKIPKIPYSREELKKAKELGERLVLRISEDGEGNAMTMEHLYELIQARTAKDKGGFWTSNDWHKAEKFYKERSLKTEWKLVGGNLLKDSKSRTYAEQTKVLRDYLKNVGSLTTAEEAECSDENLAKIADDAKKLAGLEINQKHRRSPGEVLYDSFLHFKKFKDQDYFQTNYDWTNIVYSGCFLVTFGIGPYGTDVAYSSPDNHIVTIGVVSVR